MLHFNDDRISIIQYFSKICEVISERSTCIRRKVGAIIVKNGMVISTGYNGAPKGLKHCNEVGCSRVGIKSGERHELCRGIHAEQNAIIQAAYNGINISNSILFTTTYPCTICAKMIINAGIKKIIYLNEYSDPKSSELFNEANIDVIKKTEDMGKCSSLSFI